MTDNIIDRDELQDDLIEQMIDDMDLKTMASLLYDYMNHSYDKYTVDELIEEVKEYYPHLLEESNTNWVSCLTSRQGGTRNRHRGGNRVL